MKKHNFKDKKNIEYIKINELDLLQFYSLKDYKNIITHCFTTRLGGASKGEYFSLNMGFKKNDSIDNVMENYKRLSNALGIPLENMVLSDQVHDNKVRIIGENDKGKGIIKKSDIVGYDALITNTPNVALVTFYADCVPIYFFDYEKKVIALIHSGWRGTVKEIAKTTLDEMKNSFGTEPKNVIANIGPSILQSCFEVGLEVYEEFVSILPWSKDYCINKDNGKSYIDLQGIIKNTLLKSGLLEENIFDSQICTKCNNDIFFSHRGDNGKTGSLVAVMMLK